MDLLQKSFNFNSSSSCLRCNSLLFDIEELKKVYDIDNMHDLINKIDEFEHKELKLFTIELYNIVIQTLYQRKNLHLENSIRNKNNETNSNNNNSLKNISDLSFHDLLVDGNTSSVTSSEFYTINQYTIVDNLGIGSQGTVLLGYDNSDNTGKMYAIKKIHNKKKNILHNNNDIETIKKEIAIMKKLDHDNIIKLHEVIEDKTRNIIYVVMQYMKNGPIIKKKNQMSYYTHPIEKIIKYTKQIISGLRYLHNNKIIHHDIKPENILLDNDDNIHIADFGVSEIIDKYNIVKDRNGTYYFFAPELFLVGNRIIGEHIDIWALGVTIFLMLYGEYPFTGETYNEIKENIINKNPNYPETATEKEIDFFDNILHKDINRRLNLNGIKNHPFMKYANHKDKDKDKDKIEFEAEIKVQIEKVDCESRKDKKRKLSNASTISPKDYNLAESPTYDEIEHSIGSVKKYTLNII
jgi:serine/threonine protein kinase